MKRRMIGIIAAAAMMTALTACGSDPAASQQDSAPAPTEQSSEAPADTTAPVGSEAPEESSAPAESSGITFDYVLNGVTIVVGAEAQPILDALGEPDEKPFEAPSCAFTGKSYYYKYGGCQVVTYPDEHDQSLNRIYEVSIQDNTAATNEGLTVGNTYDDIVAKCGTPDRESAAYAMYQDGEKAVQFFLESNDISSIVYTIMFN